MGSYNRKNGYYWILTAIEILSRYAFAIPVYRKDTKNVTKAVNELLEQFRERYGGTAGLPNLMMEKSSITLELRDYWREKV